MFLLLKIKELDLLIGLLISRLKEEGVYDNVNIVIVSDHGMTTFKDDNVILIKNYLDETLIDRNKTVFGIISNIYAVPGSVN